MADSATTGTHASRRVFRDYALPTDRTNNTRGMVQREPSRDAATTPLDDDCISNRTHNHDDSVHHMSQDKGEWNDNDHGNHHHPMIHTLAGDATAIRDYFRNKGASPSNSWEQGTVPIPPHFRHDQMEVFSESSLQQHMDCRRYTTSKSTSTSTCSPPVTSSLESGSIPACWQVSSTAELSEVRAAETESSHNVTTTLKIAVP